MSIVTAAAAYSYDNKVYPDPRCHNPQAHCAFEAATRAILLHHQTVEESERS